VPSPSTRCRALFPTRRWLVVVLLIGLARPGETQTTAHAFIPLSNGTVAVVDTGSQATLSVLPSITSLFSAAASPDGRWVYAASAAEDTIIVIDVAIPQAVATIVLPAPGFATAFSPDGRSAYVTLASGAVQVIDVLTHSLQGAPIVLPGSTGALGIDVSPDGQTAYAVTDAGLFPINLPLRTVGAPIGSGVLIDVAVTRDGQTAFITSLTTNTVEVVNLATWTAEAPIPVGSFPYNVAISPDGLTAYVTNYTAQSVSVIAVPARMVVATIPVGQFPVGIEFTPDGQQVYVAQRASTALAIIDVATDVVVNLAMDSEMTPESGHFITPTLLVPEGGPLTVSGDADLAAAGFRGFVPFLGGTLRITSPTVLTTNRHLSLLAAGGTIATLGGNAGVSGNLTGPGTLTKTGAGGLALSGSATHAGTIVAGGTLTVLGTHAAPITVAGGILSGDGSVSLVTVASGGLSPGNGIGILHADAVTLSAGAALQIQLTGTTVGTGYDRLDVGGATALNGATLTVTTSFAPSPGTTFLIATNVTGTFAGLAEGAVFAAGGRTYRISYVGGDGNDAVLTALNLAPTIAPIGPQTVPENGTLTLSITVGDPDDGPANLTAVATSSDQAILRDGSGVEVNNDACCVTNGGATRPLRIQPEIGVRGTVTVTVAVSDGITTTTTSFIVTVTGTTYYLAEGATGAFFDTDILLANPNLGPAPISMLFHKANGEEVALARTLPAQSRTTIAANTLAGLEATAFSTVVTSLDGLPLAVERTMRWDASGYGAHGESAAAGAALTWYFAEGAQGYFSTFLLLNNPQTLANVAHITYFTELGTTVSHDYPLAARARTTIDLGSDAALANRSFGIRVTFDRPAMAERAMYFGATPVWEGGHASAGSPTLSPTWFFAEGATGAYFTTFLLLANPNSSAVDVTLTYFPSTGVAVTRTATIPAGQRLTRNIALEDPSLASAAVATHVSSSLPIVAERSQYWGEGRWIEAHNSAGVTAAGLRWMLAEGRVGGPNEAQTFVLLANPGPVAASVTVTFLRTSGAPLVKTFMVGPTSRFNVAVNGAGSQVPELIDEAFGAVIDSTQPIVVERSLYSNANGVTWAAGTNVTATPLP
jgi:YVTN family beta-propeller protein